MAYDTCEAFYSSPKVTYEDIITSLKKHFSFRRSLNSAQNSLTVPLFAFYFLITTSVGAIFI